MGKRERDPLGTAAGSKWLVVHGVANERKARPIFVNFRLIEIEADAI